MEKRDKAIEEVASFIAKELGATTSDAGYGLCRKLAELLLDMSPEEREAFREACLSTAP